MLYMLGWIDVFGLTIRKLNYYLSHNVLQAIGLVLLLFIGVNTFIQLLKEFHQISPQYSLGLAARYVMLRLPSDIYSFFPIIALTGSVLGMGGLSKSNELIAMQAMGMSSMDLLKPVILVVVAILTLVTWLGEGVGLYLSQLALTHKIQAVSRGEALPTSQGTWLKLADSFVYVRSLSPHHRLQGVVRFYLNKNNRLTSIAYSRHGSFEKNQIIVYNVHRSHLKETNITADILPKEVWPLQHNASLLALTQHRPNQLNLYALYQSIASQSANNFITMKHYQLTFWTRLFQPLLTLLLVISSTQFIFNWNLTSTASARILIGLLWGVGFYVLNTLLSPLSVTYAVPPLTAVVFPIVLLICVSCWFMRGYIRSMYDFNRR